MAWPLSQDYNEAIQDLRGSVSDAELKTGEVVTNALGIPMPRSGNFADVYEVRCPSGTRWAVKCFTRQVRGLRERYAEISKFLQQAQLPFMVDFQYLEQGIRIRGQWYPVLKMQWVEGFLLNEFVRDNLQRKPVLLALGQIWLRMARRLREARLAHCDLQHGNVLFVPGSTASSLAIKLIDYDGMWVPALAGQKSGEVGHPAFQHPERLRTGAYGPEVDRFPLLAVATALRCLAVGGRDLWDRYDNGDNLLFRQADLQAPAQSPLFAELRQLGDPQSRALVKQLEQAIDMPLEQTPLLPSAAVAEKPAARAAATMAIAAQPAVEPQADWDFGNEAAPAARTVKKDRDRVAREGLPGWAWGAIGAAATLLLLSVGVGVGLALRSGSGDRPNTLVAQAAAPARPRDVARQPARAEPQQPAAVQEVAEEQAPPEVQQPLAATPLRDALLVMNFEKDSFYQQAGKTYVRDLSGRGNDGLCEKAAYTADGQAGGGLASDHGYLRFPPLSTTCPATPSPCGLDWRRPRLSTPGSTHNQTMFSGASIIIFPSMEHGSRASWRATVRARARWRPESAPCSRRWKRGSGTFLPLCSATAAPARASCVCSSMTTATTFPRKWSAAGCSTPSTTWACISRASSMS